MSTTKIDGSQIDYPGTAIELLSGDGSTGVTVGANLTLSGGVLSGPSTNLRAVLFVTTNGDDGTADGSINKPFSTLQAAHNYAVSNFDPSQRVVIAIAPGVYGGVLDVSRERTHFSAIGTITSSDRTVQLTKAVVTVDCRSATSVLDDTVSFEGIYITSDLSSSRPVVQITGTGLFSTIFNACTVVSASNNANNFAIYCDNTSGLGQPVIELRDSVASSTDVSTDSITLNAERGDWRLYDSQAVNYSTKIASALVVVEDAVASAEGSTLASQGFVDTVLLDGTLTHPAVKLRLNNSTVQNTSPGDGVVDCGAINLGRRQYVVATNCVFNVVDVSKATFFVNGANPSYLDLGGEKYIGASNRLIFESVTLSRLDSWRGQYTFVTADYTALLTDYVIDCDGNFKVTMPETMNLLGRMFTVKNSGLGSIIVQSTAGETFDGAPNVVLGSLDVIRLMSTGTSWILL